MIAADLGEEDDGDDDTTVMEEPDDAVKVRITPSLRGRDQQSAYENAQQHEEKRKRQVGVLYFRSYTVSRKQRTRKSSN